MPPVTRLLFVVTERGRLKNHTIFTRIITYKPISKNTLLQFATIYLFQTIFHQICWAWAIFRRKLKSDMTEWQNDELIWGGLGNLRFLQVREGRKPGVFMNPRVFLERVKGKRLQFWPGEVLTTSPVTIAVSVTRNDFLVSSEPHVGIFIRNQ